MDASAKEVESENSVLLRVWKKEIRQHIKKFIVPVLSKGSCGHIGNEELFNKLCEHVSKEASSCCCGLPITKRAKSIHSVKQSMMSVESFFSKKSYRYDAYDTKDGSNLQLTGPILIGVVQADGGLRNHLYLADASAHVVTLMIQPKTEYINAVVLIKEWKYLAPDSDVSLKLPGYIEVTGDVVVLWPNQSCAEPQHKPKKIVGVVTHVSSILSYQTWAFVMTVLTEEEDKEELVFVKNKSLAFFSEVVTIGTIVSCISVKNVRMKWQGRSKSLYCLAESGSIEILDNFIETTNMNNTIFKKYMIEKLEICIAERDLFQDHNCTSYIGEITNIISESLGIYALDGGDAILHTAYQLCPDYGIGRRIGSLIMITYAHQFQGVDGKLNLVCCKKSNITIIRFSNRLCNWRPIQLLGNEFLARIIKCNYYIHPQQLNRVVNFTKCLRRNFNFLDELDQVYPGRTDSVVCKLLMPNQNAISERNEHIGVYTEVLSEPHTCVASQSIKKPIEEYRMFSIKELSDGLLRMGNDFHSTRYREYWCHTVLSDSFLLKRTNSQKFILGCIDSNDNGKIVIRDNSGMIELAVMTENHEKTSGTKYFPWCTQDIGCFVRIQQFSVVIEMLYDPTIHFGTPDLHSSSDHAMTRYLSNTSYHFYIVALSSDIQVICSRSGDISVTTLGCSKCNIADEANSDSSPHKKRSCLSEKQPVDQFVTFLICVTQQPTSFNQYLLKGYVEDGRKDVPKMVTFDLKNVKKWKAFIRAGVLLKIMIPQVKDTHGIIILDDNCCVFHHHVEGHPLLQRSPVEKIWPFEEVIKQRSSLPIRGKVVCREGHLDNNTHRQRLYFTSTDDSSKSVNLCIYLGKTIELDLPDCFIPGCIAVLTPGKVCVSEKGNVYCKSCHSITVEWMPMVQWTPTASDTQIQSLLRDDGGSWKPSILRDLLISQNSAEWHSPLHPIIINVFPVEVLSVKISSCTADATSLDGISFYAKCTVSDHTGTGFLSFDSSFLHEFFTFIGVEDSILHQFLETVTESKELVYNPYFHNSDNAMRMELVGEECKDMRILILLCNNANVSALPPLCCLVRRACQGYKYAQPNQQTVGAVKENSMHSDDYKDNHFHFIRFLE